MNKLLVVSLLALSFATGFTCSKNAPAEQAAAPAVSTEAVPASGDVAPAAPAVPAETK